MKLTNILFYVLIAFTLLCLNVICNKVSKGYNTNQVHIENEKVNASVKIQNHKVQNKKAKGDTDVVRKVIKDGVGGTSPKEKDLVTVHYVITLTDGKVIDSTRNRGKPYTFTVGSALRCLNEGITMMTTGERSTLTCSPAAAYGDAGFPPVVPKRSYLIMDVELLYFSAK